MICVWYACVCGVCDVCVCDVRDVLGDGGWGGNYKFF